MIPKQDEAKEVEIAGTYSGTDNVGMKSTIIMREGGVLIIHASVGDDSPDYGNWTGTAKNFFKDFFRAPSVPRYRGTTP